MNKSITRKIALLLALSLVFTCLSACGKDKPSEGSSIDSSTVDSSTEDPSSVDPSSVDSSIVDSSSTVSSQSKPSSSSTPTEKQPTSGLLPPSGDGIALGKEVNIAAPNGTLYNKGGSAFSYSTPMDMEDNVFMDSLIYTGYSVEQQRKDGLMWQYILSKQKHKVGSGGAYAWLSKISYGGVPSGYEKNKDGKPDIDYFNRAGLVCASFVGYVYANYLPNVAGIDTSMLKKPRDYGWSDVLADSWYEVAKMWVKEGYSEFIPFAQGKASNGCLKITPAKSIPIGSIIVTTDGNHPTDYAAHISVYAGYKNGYNWVYHVGTTNGPEFCCIERMAFVAPQKLIAIISTPNCINFAPKLEVTVQDASGNPVSNASVTAVRDKNGKSISFGNTDASGKASKSYLYYDGMTVNCTARDGRTGSAKITLDAKNNSSHKLTVTVK